MDIPYDLGPVKAHVLSLPEVILWPELVDLIDQAGGRKGVDWAMPLVACEAVGGEPTLATPASSAILCLQMSIIFVDNILDEDPAGEHRELGYGPTANLALALEAAAFRVVAEGIGPPGVQAAVISNLASMALETARGQHLDTKRPVTEEDYWQIVQAKSTPFYSVGLYIGALIGGADTKTADALRKFGVLMGEIVQLHDDLSDAFSMPAKPDWEQQSNNLLILYALVAEHPSHARFLELLPHVGDRERLREAQQILIDCGAVSYCGFQLARRLMQARHVLENAALASPGKLLELVDEQKKPLVNLLQSAGAEVPKELQEEV